MSRSWPRIIVHADMDAFYASVEQLDHPELRGCPVLVGPPSERGVVLTASYEARPFGVASAMPMIEARRRCPEALIVPPRFDRYRDVSQGIMRVFKQFAPAVEPLSLDEAFLDMSGAEDFFGTPSEIGKRIKAAVFEATGGLTVSVGISGTKYVAKVASGYAKPDGLTIVAQDSARSWLAPQPVARLWGAGPKTQQRLLAAGYRTIGDVARADPRVLERAFGRMGVRFHRLANANDPRAVMGMGMPKSLSSERTFERDLGARAEIEFQIRESAGDVGRRLRRHGYAARGVRLKLKTAGFELLTRQRRLPDATQSSHTINAAAASLLPALLAYGPFRLVGVGAYDIVRPEEQTQPGLALDTRSLREQRLEKTLDQVEQRFGAGTLRRGAESLRARHVGAAMDQLPDDETAMDEPE